MSDEKSGFSPTIDTGGGNIENLAQTIDQDKSTSKQVNNVDTMEDGASITQNVVGGDVPPDLLAMLLGEGVPEEEAPTLVEQIGELKEGMDAASPLFEPVKAAAIKYGPTVAKALSGFLPYPFNNIVGSLADGAA